MKKFQQLFTYFISFIIYSLIFVSCSNWEESQNKIFNSCITALMNNNGTSSDKMKRNTFCFKECRRNRIWCNFILLMSFIFLTSQEPVKIVYNYTQKLQTQNWSMLWHNIYYISIAVNTIRLKSNATLMNWAINDLIKL